MLIRKLEQADLEVVSSICMGSFLNSVAGSLSEQGISTFTKLSNRDAFLERMKKDNLILVAENNGCVEGVVELREGRHIAMLFVAPEHQNKGIGKRLIASVLSFARCNTVSVNASLSSVPAYQKYGFECNGQVEELSGLVYQPMLIQLSESI